MRNLRAVITHGDVNHELVSAFGRFRKELFIDQLGWILQQRNFEEIDEFDRPDTIYTILLDEHGVIGGFRALCCDRPYLAQTIFPDLADLRQYPLTPDCWEISRFGVADATGVLARINYALMFHFAQMRQARSLVAIADLCYERYLKIQGIHTKRYGPPKIIGHTRSGTPIEVVAGEIPMTSQSGRRFNALLSCTSQIEIIDEAHILRLIAV